MTLPLLSSTDALTRHAITSAKPPPEAVGYDGELYVLLDVIAELLDAKLDPPDISATTGAANLFLVSAGKTWSFPNGGDRVVEVKSDQMQKLEHPLLMLDGRHYISMKEGAELFGYTASVKEDVTLENRGKQIRADIMDAGSPFFCHAVSNLGIAHGELITRCELSARSALHQGAAILKLPAGTRLVQRRTLTLDGSEMALVTDAEKLVNSYIINLTELKSSSDANSAKDTYFMRQMEWFRQTSTKGEGLQYGRRERLTKTVCVSADFCWSMRRYENPLLDMLAERSKVSSDPVEPVFFISGRWLEQHPEEMHNLLVYDAQPNLNVTWGLHSWIHPKEGDFMKAYSPDQLRADTLRLEVLLLRWGIVPTVFYRFPGLIHDEVCRTTLLDMDLFLIDCDSWLAMLVNNEVSPFAQPVQDGSIILVHGNGNEPKGIKAFQEWLSTNPDWKLRGIVEFLPQK